MYTCTCLQKKVYTCLIKHFFEVLLGVNPGCHRITKEDEVLHNTIRVYADHITHPTERRILLFVIPDITQ